LENEMAEYELQSLKLPRLNGLALKLFTAVVENRLTRGLLIASLLENGGIPKLRRTHLDEAPTFYPLVAPPAAGAFQETAFEPGPQPQGFPYRTAHDYAAAYRQGALTPVEVAERVMNAIAASDQGELPLRAFMPLNREDLLAQAKASSERIAAGHSLSLLDGVPVAVKDEVDMCPYPTTVGTTFLGTSPAAHDSTVAARLRNAGALLVGKTNMHEIGINPNGFNAHYGTVRNPFDPTCDTGGSSSGSAAAVAAGLVPIAIGADGGGSIRIPAALCGIVGLMPTFGRVSEFGAAPLCWSVAHLGPLAASVADAALAYSIVAGPDPRDPNSMLQPPVTLSGWNHANLRGVRLGIYPQWFEHANAEVLQVCRDRIEQFKAAGAEVREVVIPGLDEMRISQAITILSEMASAMSKYRAQRQQMGAAVRLSLVLGEAMTSSDYLQAQQVRTRAMQTFCQVFQQVDAILTPATALAAQTIMPGGLPDGWSDLGTDTEMMRFIFPANLTGHPAISFPAGYDGRGLPIGMQAIGRHWEEHLLLRLAYTAEQDVTRRQPGRFYPILS
jgi:Asp-tRNA(Asn)/Glu-tRNA(Gln) amidotransferase A subunit family amidase